MRRIYAVKLNKGDHYYLCLLLNNDKGSMLFDNLKIVNNQKCETFKDSILKRKLIEPEQMYQQTMQEDFARNGIPNSYPRINAVLLYIKALMKQHYKSLNNYDLPLLKQSNDL
ncbi:28660_t:CDS:2 [Gigaspora margarita]|uniref:28660_t:CDS:1 n=1 Tax=Gigaspora margarita TaxID=4874 RepID=A0ABM8VY28_GIGMA|nr:28660_t:CDS:2 [Gigaspora margarita]